MSCAARLSIQLLAATLGLGVHPMWRRPLGGHRVHRGHERQAQPAQEENPEQRARDREVVRSGEDGYGTGSVRSGLGKQQGTRRRGKVRKMRLKRVLITSSGSSALPASQVVGRFVRSVAWGGRPPAWPFAKVGRGSPAPRSGWRPARLRRRRRHGLLVSWKQARKRQRRVRKAQKDCETVANGGIVFSCILGGGGRWQNPQKVVDPGARVYRRRS